MNYKDLEIDLENCYDYETFRRGFIAQFEYEANQRFCGIEDWYKILGVNKNVTPEELKKLHRKLSKEYHPDRGGDQRKFDKIQRAYDILSNPELKKEFDELYDDYKIYAKVKSSPEYYEKLIERAFKENLKNQHRKQPNEEFYDYDEEDDEYYYNTFDYIMDNVRDFLSEERDRFADAWDELKEEKQPTFKQRHKRAEKFVFNNYYFDDMTKAEFVLFQLKRCGIHAGREIVFQAKKLCHPFQDGAEKYILRNRFIPVYALIVALAMYGFGALGNDVTPDFTDQSMAQETIQEEYEDEQVVYNDYVVLNEYYTIHATDTLSELAENANISLSTLQSLNNIDNPSLIRMGDEIVIPYKVKLDDLMYYEQSKPYDNSISLEEFARENHTDITTLLALNEEAIIEDHGVYTVLSSSLNVPKFITLEELEEKQAQYNY